MEEQHINRLAQAACLSPEDVVVALTALPLAPSTIGPPDTPPGKSLKARQPGACPAQVLLDHGGGRRRGQQRQLLELN